VRTDGQYCPVARTPELFAERWTPIIIRNLLGGVTTLGQLQAGAPGIPKAVLTDRLAALGRAGIVERRPGPARRVTYHLTDAGRDLGLQLADGGRPRCALSSEPVVTARIVPSVSPRARRQAGPCLSSPDLGPSGVRRRPAEAGRLRGSY
jgi:DNA-binding HxlR family transcriptional regulator